MKQVTVNIPDSFYNSFIEFFKHIPEVTIKEEVSEDIPNWQKKILDERLAKHRTDPKGGTSWDDFEKELDAI